MQSDVTFQFVAEAPPKNRFEGGLCHLHISVDTPFRCGNKYLLYKFRHLLDTLKSELLNLCE